MNLEKLRFLKILTIIFIIFISTNSFSQNIPITEKNLFGCWTHSMEESTRNDSNEVILVYRPCKFKKFPPLLYRHRIELKDNGQCSWLFLADDDGHYMVNGSWLLEKETRVIKIHNLNGSIEKQFKIVDLKNDILNFKEFL